MYLMTTHCGFVGIDKGSLVQVQNSSDPRTLKLSDDSFSQDMISSGPLAGFRVTRVEQGIALSRDGRFACAIPGQERIELDRTGVATWETFLPIPDENIGMFSRAAFDPAAEQARFARRVAELNAAGQPVKIYPGCGTVPRPGFLNLDIDVNAPQFLLTNRNDYFIFPFVCKWDIPDNSVDYIYDEDFVEHISQLMQWQFFAEAYRVLKPGCFHRVNTPNVIAAMKRHSRFNEGFSGVYTGEEQWGHIAILSHFQLKEIAETIGYSEVIFTTRSCGVSPYAERDFRPAPDRDDVGGNIYADLRK
ncbi:class I SAM-dependent methyltransferase [Methylorubrum extorquens]|uniref:class I SAM-dependent methyltransferase n=1 Tax=Methylorubrum extorquens TaxID=408 RepID=UPI0022370CDF|nr:class I SAM-dependent methyltransferase [Methylorubrum extorquens]UYW25911.1 class I SAM-dependent methyltransferase [Methylorubrum extorquens]